MRDDRERLLDIREAIERIEKYAARGLSVDFRNQYPAVPWSQIIGMRNVLTHRYFGIDVDIVWSAVERDLPDLKHKLAAILREMDSP